MVMQTLSAKKTSEYELGDPELCSYIKECELELRFTAFDASIAYDLGNFMKTRFTRLHDASEAMYIQIRSFPARPGAPFVLFAAMAGNVEKLGAGIAHQIEGKARVVEHAGESTMGLKAFAAMMGWETEKMGLYRPDYIVNGGGFPVKLTNCPTPVGAIIVSGLPDVEDHQFIVDSLGEFLRNLKK